MLDNWTASLESKGFKIDSADGPDKEGEIVGNLELLREFFAEQGLEIEKDFAELLIKESNIVNSGYELLREYLKFEFQLHAIEESPENFNSHEKLKESLGRVKEIIMKKHKLISEMKEELFFPSMGDKIVCKALEYSEAISNATDSITNKLYKAAYKLTTGISEITEEIATEIKKKEIEKEEEIASASME